MERGSFRFLRSFNLGFPLGRDDFGSVKLPRIEVLFSTLVLSVVIGVSTRWTGSFHVGCSILIIHVGRPILCVFTGCLIWSFRFWYLIRSLRVWYLILSFCFCYTSFGVSTSDTLFWMSVVTELTVKMGLSPASHRLKSICGVSILSLNSAHPSEEM